MVGQQVQRHPYSFSSSPEKLLSSRLGQHKHLHHQPYCVSDSSLAEGKANRSLPLPSLHQTRFKSSFAPMVDRIPAPHENDVLMGRGGKNNAHSGNGKLREMARLEADNYRNSTKKGKSQISRRLVRQMRQLKPAARFLKKCTVRGDWEEVGEDTAREKSSQVLRDAVNALPDIATSSKSGDEEGETDAMDHETPTTQLTMGTRSRPRGQAKLPSDEPTPTLESVSSSMPPATPLTVGSRKRRRENQSMPPHSFEYDSYSPSREATPNDNRLNQDTRYSDSGEQYSLSSRQPYYPSANDEYHDRQQYHHRQYHYYRQPQQPNLPDRGLARPTHIRNRDVSNASAQSLLGGVRDHPTGAADYDLFHGELLASDDEGACETNAPRGRRH